MYSITYIPKCCAKAVDNNLKVTFFLFVTMSCQIDNMCLREWQINNRNLFNMNNIFRRASNVAHYLAKALPTDWYWLKRSVKYSMLYRGEEYLANRLLIMGHSVEKGITMPNRRYGFGYGVVRLLISLCKEYQAMYGAEKDAFQIALDDLREYLQIHKEVNFELPKDIEGGITQLLAFKTGPNVDCNSVTNEEFFAYTDFASFAHSRHTCRWFSDEEISDETIKSVIALANTAPSACNRQSVRVKCVSGEKKNEILGMQNGNRGFGDHINKLLVVTFLQPAWEYDIQSAGYLDAGIYTMNILYALHYHKLCACTLNAHFEVKNISKVQQILNLSPWEVPTVFIGVGKPLEKMMIAKSERIDIGNVISFVN